MIKQIRAFSHRPSVVLLLFGVFVLLDNTALADSKLYGDPPGPEVVYRDSVYRRAIREGSTTLSCYLSYPQGGADVLRNYGNNSYELGKLGEFIRTTLSDTSIYVHSVQVSGYCSIEGRYTANEELAAKRSALFRRFLLTEYPFLNRYNVLTNPVGEDWKTLRNLVANSSFNEKSDILKIIDQSDFHDEREKNLLILNEGLAYKIIEKHFFPLLRRVEVTVEYDLHRIIEDRYHRKLSESEFLILLEQEREKARLSEARLQKELEELRALHTADSIASSNPDTRYDYFSKKPSVSPKKYLLFGFKTNIYSFLGFTTDLKRTTYMPNLELECFFAKHWSTAFSLLYSYRNFSENEFWGVSAYKVEPRFWFSRKGKYRGLYIGAYGLMGDFDIRRNVIEKITTDNRTGTYYEGGLSLGYVYPISKRWIIETGVSGGYRHIKDKSYQIEGDKHYFLNDETRKEFKVTDIRFGIGYRFGKMKK